MKRLFVLIACEESQAETIAFRALGHHAYSCDVQPCSVHGCADWHIQGDVTPFLKGRYFFYTQAGSYRVVPKWDLIIAHPPCTYLSRISSPAMMQDADLRISVNGQDYFVNSQRYRKMLDARAFFNLCLNADAPFVAVENPIPMALADLPKPTTYACPSWFGAEHTKRTLYWLKGLPPLMPKIVPGSLPSLVARTRGKYRSRTDPRLAVAIAEQWGDFVVSAIK